jgi:hypothetical protein
MVPRFLEDLSQVLISLQSTSFSPTPPIPCPTPPLPLVRELAAMVTVVVLLPPNKPDDDRVALSIRCTRRSRRKSSPPLPPPINIPSPSSVKRAAQLLSSPSWLSIRIAAQTTRDRRVPSGMMTGASWLLDATMSCGMRLTIRLQRASEFGWTHRSPFTPFKVSICITFCCDTPDIALDFDPPRHPAGMQALLADSVQSYGPLPSELRAERVRSRKNSRLSPYPGSNNRVRKISTSTHSSTPPRATPSPEPAMPATTRKATTPGSALKDKTPHTYVSNVPLATTTNKKAGAKTDATPKLGAFQPLSPLVVDIDTRKETLNEMNRVRPRVGSNARRTALGWTKRAGKSSSEMKENSFNQSMVITT